MSDPDASTSSSRETPEYTALRDQVVLLLVNGASQTAVMRFAGQRAGAALDPAALVADARSRIAVAAQVVRTEELGKAVMRLDDLYARAIQKQDYRFALRVQHEINRLHGLEVDTAEPEAHDEAAADAQRTLDLVAGHLRPLRLLPEDYPVEEHARVAAQIAREALYGPKSRPASP